MDTKIVIYQTNDENELDSIIDLLAANTIDFLVMNNRPDPYLGQKNILFMYDIYVPINQQDMAFDLIKSIITEDEIESSITEPITNYKDLSQYYRNIFNKFDTKSTYSNMTWNWAAFFLTWIWYIYHKMYLNAIFTFALLLFVSFLGPIPSAILRLAISVYVGIYGNYDKYLSYKKKNG